VAVAADTSVRLGPAGLACEDVRRVAVERARLELAPEVDELMRRGREVIERAVDGDELVYGLNTLLGHGRDERLPREALVGYQLDTIRGHAGGIGEPLPDEDVRAIVLVRVSSAARGSSGLHPEAVHALVDLLNAGVDPVLPAVGSVGAADLMHMGAVGLVLVGEGWAHHRGEVLPGGEALRRAGLEPYVPRPKDGHSLLVANGAAAGPGALAVLEGERLARLADGAVALMIEGIHGNPSPFDEEVVRAKPLPGQIAAAAHIRELLAGSYVHDEAVSVQDPLSVRTAPQVHGGLRDQLRFAREAVEVELNATDDNPFVSFERGELLSNGNFHPMTLALAFDALRVGIAHVAMCSERRLHRVAGAFWDVERLHRRDARRGDGPLQRGGTSYAAAAVVSELKALAAPVTVHCPPLDSDQEDHATLAPSAVAATRRALAGLEAVLACELLAAYESLWLRDEGLPRLGTGTKELYERVGAAAAAVPPAASSAALVDAVRAALV